MFSECKVSLIKGDLEGLENDDSLEGKLALGTLSLSLGSRPLLPIIVNIFPGISG